ncbi:MAG: exo-alpha-sialidase [Myxococcota bacterium]
MGVVVIVGTAKGAAILRADESRRSWAVDALRFKGWTVTAATRDAQGRYYVAVTHEVWGAAVCVSDDLESWQQLENGPRYAQGEVGNEEHNRILGATDPLGRFKGGGRYVDQIWKLYAAGDVVYAGVSEAGLFRSDDRGKSWEVVAGLNEHPTRSSWIPGFGGLCAHSVLTDGRNPDRLWVGISSTGVYRSDDGGKTWEEKNDGVSKSEGSCVHSLAHNPADADVIYRQDHRGMYRTRDGGDSWQVIENGLPISTLGDEHRCSFGFTSGMDPASNSVYAVPIESDGFRFPHGGRLRVYRTQDGGEQWEELSRGLPDGVFANVLRGAMAVDPLDPCGVYVGTTAGTVYASADRGDSWSQIPATLPRILCVEAFEG